MNSFIEGMILGLGTIVFIGPVFFLVLQNTLALGKKAGLYIALGILVSDIAYLFLLKYVLYEKLASIASSSYFYWFFALLLLVMGIQNIFKKNTTQPTLKIIANSPTILFTKGFLINFVNPFVFVFWLGVYQHVVKKYDSESEQNFFFTSAMIGIFIADIARVLLSNWLKTKLNSKILSRTYKVIGALFILFAILILTKFYN